MRIRHFILGAALCVGALTFCSPDRAGAQGMDAQQACTPDAMRLCSAYIPDRARVTSCMLANRSQLSQECRLAMGGGGKRHAASRQRAHCAKHSKHC
jgi:hypothetical protein